MYTYKLSLGQPEKQQNYVRNSLTVKKINEKKKIKRILSCLRECILDPGLGKIPYAVRN